MSKHVILESYTFTPSSRTIVINGKAVRREQLLLITNVTANTIIYNYTDPTATATGYAVTYSQNVESTTITLTYNTTLMSSTDKLAILVEETYAEIQPAETFQDSVGKMRVSNPQALIDTDFEYGVQSTKWETLSLINNRPGAFYDPTQGISNVSNTLNILGNVGVYQVTAITGGAGRLVTVTINNTTGITTSTPVFIQDTTDSNANGWYIPQTVTANTSFTYYARGTVAGANVFDPNKTYVFIGAFYTQAGIPLSSTTAFTYSSTAVTCTTQFNHGLTVGQAIYVVGTTATTNPPNGSWFVRQTPTSNTFIFDVVNAPTGTISNTANNLTLYPRTWGSSVHRAYDGGVTFTAGYPYHGNQLIRQTRRIFRYQSGKGIQFSTGSNMCSTYQVDSITSSGTTVTVQCKFPHNLGVGAIIKVFSVDQTAYNGNFAVTSIPTDTSFTYTALSTPATTVATSINGFYVQPYQWYGGAVRLGMFTSQNGFFYEYNGQTLSVVKRSSTSQISGYISSLANGSQTVTGTNSYWSKQLLIGDFIVIRGQSYRVLSIESDTSMTIYPDYRGTTISSPATAIVSKTVETRIPQSSWNIDRMDGTGSSPNVIDITKMQMWYMDYTWYGAGAIRWGIKDHRGEIKYVHRLANGNNVTEAYMRSGNLPGRYEVNTFYPLTQLTQTLNSGDTTCYVTSTTGFPNTGTIIVSQSGNTGANIEYIGYSGVSSTSFNNLTRALTNLTGPGGLTSGGGTGTAVTFTYSATAPIGIAYWGPQAANTISHWGSSVIMDGRYDDDKSLIFVAGMQTAINNVAAGVTQPLISIRVAPSVDSGLTGILGQREIINTMQLIMRTCDAFTTGTGATFLMTLRLNGNLSGGVFVPAGGSSLSQVCYHSSGQTITGGETMYGFFTNTPGVTSGDLSLVRDVGNSIIGGGNSYNVPTGPQGKYPDGPDVVTICCTNVSGVTPNSINARISWTEAQA